MIRNVYQTAQQTKAGLRCFTRVRPPLAVIYDDNIVWITCWSVGERRGVVSQLLPAAVSAVQPAAETHQGQPRGHAQSCDEGRLPHHAGDLLRYAEVAAFVNGRCFVCWESCKEKFESGLHRARGKKENWPFKQCSLAFSYPETWRVEGGWGGGGGGKNNCLTFWKTVGKNAVKLSAERTKTVQASS